MLQALQSPEHTGRSPFDFLYDSSIMMLTFI